MSETIRISVRDLVEFVMRSGDLDERAAGAAEEAMLEGARMHRKLQREEGPEYTAEVPLSICYPIRLPEEDETGNGCAAPEGPAAEEQPAAQAGTAGKPASAGEAAVLIEGRADGILSLSRSIWRRRSAMPIFMPCRTAWRRSGSG